MRTWTQKIFFPAVKQVEALEDLRKKLGGTLIKGRIWRLEGTKNGIAYVIKHKTYRFMGFEYIYDQGLSVFVQIKTKKEFKILTNGVYGKDADEAKKFFERNKNEILKLSKLTNPIEILMVKNGEMETWVADFSGMFAVPDLTLPNKRFQNIPSVLDLLIMVAKRENKQGSKKK